MPDSVLRIGSRGSKLALAQAEYTAALLRRTHPDLTIEMVTITTTGDRDRRSSLSSIGGTGLFTKQIEQALIDDQIDVAVHSAKDLPSVMTGGLALGAVPPREVHADVWISRDNSPVETAGDGTRVGTSSPRRKAQILNARPGVTVGSIRGNVETRLRKLANGEFDAVLMALAGLKRLGLDNRVTQILDTDRFLPAPGQGALAVQIRQDDTTVADIVSGINHQDSRRCLEIERLLLKRLEAGCSTPVGGLARIAGAGVTLEAVVLDSEGSVSIFAKHTATLDDSDDLLVQTVVNQLLTQGAKALIHG
ncbi:MAG: hydroxymethylbilane synthase [candidate division Zixibacteria bacterium]|nr:hydroxymethylbilane synthase [candidate division Zixibacteria bacterium]